MKFVKLLIIAAVIFTSGNLFAQDINDSHYKFKINLPAGWVKTKTEETSRKDAISYSFDKNRADSSSIMILAFKVSTVKNLDDFIYTLEKDGSLNIGTRSGGYSDFDLGSVDGRSAVYKDNDFTETIYFYRTKNNTGDENYAYMLRFISRTSSYNNTVKDEIKRIADSFQSTL